MHKGNTNNSKKRKRIRIIGIITATNKNKNYCHELELLFPFVRQLFALFSFVSTYKTCLRRNRNNQEFIINIYEPFMFIHDYSCSAAGKRRNELP